MLSRSNGFIRVSLVTRQFSKKTPSQPPKSSSFTRNRKKMWSTVSSYLPTKDNSPSDASDDSKQRVKPIHVAQPVNNKGENKPAPTSRASSWGSYISSVGTSAATAATSVGSYLPSAPTGTASTKTQSNKKSKTNLIKEPIGTETLLEGPLKQLMEGYISSGYVEQYLRLIRIPNHTCDYTNSSDNVDKEDKKTETISPGIWLWRYETKAESDLKHLPVDPNAMVCERNEIFSDPTHTPIHTHISLAFFY